MKLFLMSKLFAVSGTKGSGKDTATSMLQYCLSVPKVLRNYTCYKWLHRFIRPKYKKLAFADPLKKMLSVLLNEPYESFNNRAFKECYMVDLENLTIHYGIECMSDSKFNRMVKTLDPELSKSVLTIRQLMQYFGTEISQRFFGRRVWINSTLKHCTGPTIISDLRFKEEYNAIKERNGITIFIYRPGYEFGQHASEKEMEELYNNSQYDHVIINNGSLQQLFNSVKDILCRVKI